MDQKITIIVNSDDKWDFVHRFRNFGEDVFRALRSTCTVDIYEIDASTDNFSVRAVSAEKSSQICEVIRGIADKHFFGERLKLKIEDAEHPAAG